MGLPVVPGADRLSRSKAPALVEGVMYIIPQSLVANGRGGPFRLITYRDNHRR